MNEPLTDRQQQVLDFIHAHQRQQGVSPSLREIQAHFGLAIQPRLLSLGELQWLAAVVGAALLASVVPGYRAYRLSLSDGLVPRL